MSERPKLFQPQRGGHGSQAGAASPPAAYWQPPETLPSSPFWRFKEGGIFLGWCDDIPLGVKDDRHLVTIAGARAGKTSTLLIPNLLQYRGATLVLDPKGELASKTAQHRRDVLGHAVHVLDPWGAAKLPADLKPASFNPLQELLASKPDDLADNAALMAEALIQGSGHGSDHWESAAQDFVRAAILYLVINYEKPTLDRLPIFLAECMAINGKEHPDDDHFAQMESLRDDGRFPIETVEIVRNAGLGMIGTNDKERASILSTARNQLGFLESRPLHSNLAESTFKLEELKTGSPDGKPVTIYLCLPASRMGTHAKWLRLFLNMTIATLESVKAEPALPVLLMLEEFAALGHLRALEQAAAYMAGFGVKAWIVLQDLTQLKRHYKEGWETFIGNAGVLVSFGNNDQSSLDYMSKRLGECYLYITERGHIKSTDNGSGVRENFQKAPLLAPHEVAVEFGRRRMNAIGLPADGPPIAIERRHVDLKNKLGFLRSLQV